MSQGLRLWIVATALLIASCADSNAGLEVTAITISGAPSTFLAPAKSAQLVAKATYSDNSVRDVTTTVSWSTSDPNVLVVSPAGLLTAVAPGRADATATMLGQTGTVAVQVSLPAAYFADGVEYAFEYQLDARGRVDSYRTSFEECQGSLHGTYECWRRVRAGVATASGVAGRLVRTVWPTGTTGTIMRSYAYGPNGLSEVVETRTPSFTITTTLRYDSSGRLQEVSETSAGCDWFGCDYLRRKSTRIAVDSSGRLQHADTVGFYLDPVSGAETFDVSGSTDWTYGSTGWCEQVVSSESQRTTTDRFAVDADGWLVGHTRSVADTQPTDSYAIVRSAEGILEEHFSQNVGHLSQDMGGRIPDPRLGGQSVRYELGRLPSEPLFVPRAVSGMNGADYFGLISNYLR